MRKALLAAVVLGVFIGAAVFVGILRTIQPSIVQTVNHHQTLFQQTAEPKVDPATGQVLERQELSNQGNEQDSRIAELTEQLQRVLDAAVANDQLVTDEYGNQVLAPEPARQAQQLQTEIRDAYEEKLARPAEQRAQAIENLQRFLEDARIEGETQYRSTIVSPYDGATVEYYEIGKYDAMISMGNDRILQLGPRSLPPGEEPIQYNEAPEYSPEELEAMARTFIQKRAPELNLDELTPDHGNKDETNYFFQWKRSSEERIHVGYTVGGDFLSYLDTLTTKNP